jgi:hypothetical protein
MNPKLKYKIPQKLTKHPKIFNKIKEKNKIIKLKHLKKIIIILEQEE